MYIYMHIFHCMPQWLQVVGMTALLCQGVSNLNFPGGGLYFARVARFPGIVLALYKVQQRINKSSQLLILRG